MLRKWISLLVATVLVCMLVAPMVAVADTQDDVEDKEFGYVRHPMGWRLALTMAGDEAAEQDAAYEDVMAWYEEGYGFGEIMVALLTSRISEDEDDTVESLLEQKDQGYGWGEIWQDLGLVGGPGAAMRERARGQSASKGQLAGPPEGRPVGPPEDRPAGSPDDRPVGPPDGVSAGPPDGVPAGGNGNNGRGGGHP